LESFARVFKLHEVLQARRSPLGVDALCDQLGCSRASLYRTLARLRDEFGAPILSAQGRGVFYDRSAKRFELPGLWFNANEMHALLAMDALIENLGPGMLRESVGPLRARIAQLLASASHDTEVSAERIRERIKILGHHLRKPAADAFGEFCAATLTSVRVRFSYHGRQADKRTEREVSPWRMLNYRGNWYMEGHCHLANALRIFSIDRATNLCLLDQTAQPDVRKERPELSGYGLFASQARHKARLLFSPERARWVADESWHPEQRGQFRTDGSFELLVPYGDPRELLGEILRHGRHVEVIAPRSLRALVCGEVDAMIQRYECQNGFGASDSS
jgi:proteasome accessory factor C